MAFPSSLWFWVQPSVMLWGRAKGCASAGLLQSCSKAPWLPWLFLKGLPSPLLPAACPVPSHTSPSVTQSTAHCGHRALLLFSGLKVKADRLQYLHAACPATIPFCNISFFNHFFFFLFWALHIFSDCVLFMFSFLAVSLCH